MTDKLKEIIKRELVKLPQKKQEAIGSLDWEKVSEEIAQKFLLNETEMNDLQVQTLLVLIGLNDPDFFSKDIENNIGTSKNEAEKIADEVMEKIFLPIANKIEEKIKENLKNKNPNFRQNLDFVLSGGNYVAFLENQEAENNL